MTTKTNDGLTALDRAGINNYATLLSWGTEETALSDRGDEVQQALVNTLRETEFGLLARFLGAAMLESTVWGSRRAGQADPPVEGFLGRAIDKVIEELTPLVEARDPAFFEYVKAEDWDAE